MIHIDRNSISVPDVFFSKEIDIARKRLEEFYTHSKAKRGQQRYSRPFEKDLRIPIYEALNNLFNGKCSYCETLVNSSDKRYYDHFRPKSGARGLGDDFADEHYWWLTYRWQNFYLCCNKCNRYKSTWFPVKGPRAAISMPYEQIVKVENALLIDPCNEQPEDHLQYDMEGRIHAITEQGKHTIDILKLNRKELINGRMNALEEEYGEWERILKLWNAPTNDLRTAFDDWQRIMVGKSAKPFLGIRQFLINDRLVAHPTIGEYFQQTKDGEVPIVDIKEIKRKVEKATPTSLKELATVFEYLEDQDTYDIESEGITGHVYIESLELHNFKCFEHLKIDFTAYEEEAILPETETRDEDSKNREPWHVFLGENGVGKSSVLQAMALCLMGKNYRNKLDSVSPDAVLKDGAEEGYVKLHLVGEETPLILRFQKGQKRFQSDVTSALTLLAGYGAVRVMPKGAIKSEPQSSSITRVKNLFDYSVALTDAKKWLLRKDWDKEQFDKIALALKDLLNLQNEDHVFRKGKELYIQRNMRKELLEQQSDGYKTVIALAVDIMAFFMKQGVSFEVAEGIVLIDELGSHLHPRWKMRIVDGLRSAFPRIQFIVTTHEPLCLRGLKNGEVTVMLKNAEEEIIPITELPDPSTLRVDQLLTSPFFGLSSAIDPEKEVLFNEYYAILAKDDTDRTGEERERLHTLQEQIPRIQYLGNTLREELALYVIDELIAQTRLGKEKEQSLSALKPEVKKRVQDIWKQLEDENLEQR